MQLSLFYFVFILSVLLSAADPTEVDFQCPTRHLLSFVGISTPAGEKRTHRTSSPPKAASPPKYARSSDSNGLTVYVQPDLSKTLGQKVPSYSHLLKPKLRTNEQKHKSKRSHVDKKKQTNKKKSTQPKSSTTINKKELASGHADKHHQGKASNQIDSSQTQKTDKKIKQTKSNKPIITPKVENVTVQVKKSAPKKVAAKPTIVKTATTTALPITEKKIKDTKTNNQIDSNEKKKSSKTLINEKSEKPSLTPPIKNVPVKNVPIKTTTTTPSPSQPSSDDKSDENESDATSTAEEKANEPSKTDEDDSSSVVGRAFHFVKNVFQLSDDNLTENYTREDHIIDATSDHQYTHQSRKLLSINEDKMSIIMKNDTTDDELNFHLSDKEHNPTADDLSYIVTTISKRQILAVKSDKQQSSSKASPSKEKQSKSASKTNAEKPKVGWTYRYRISRYLAAQKTKQNSNKKKSTGEGKLKHSQQEKKSKQSNKEKKSSNERKVSKRKLLEHNDDNDGSWDTQNLSNDDIVDTVSITENFVPKRQLLLAKQKPKHEETNDDDDNNDDLDTKNPPRRMRSIEESNDPILIVQSYDRGLTKPRVGWQFRYRVSRYIESLRQHIREDHARLKLGLQDIKRKTSPELGGKRKRVSDKSSASHVDQSKKEQQETKPSVQQKNKTRVGWRYRYRISKMNEAKRRGEFIDDEQEKAKVKVEQEPKTKSAKKIQDDPSKKVATGLDPELSKINNEGRRVGWAYRYRIRRKLEFLKQQKAEKSISFDLPTLSTKQERKAAQPKSKPKEKKAISEPVEVKPKNKTQSVGWQYRYRVSKMLEAQKQSKTKVPSDKTQTKSSGDKKQDSKTTRSVSVEQKSRTRNEHKSETKSIPDKDDTNTKTLSSSSKTKKKIKSKRKAADDDEPGVVDYFRRASSSVWSGLVSTAKAPFCFLPLVDTFSFCEKENDDGSKLVKSNKSKSKPVRKLRTKKEHRAKQFIRSHITKLGADDKATEKRVDEAMKKLYKKPSLPPLQIPPATQNTENTEKVQPKQNSSKRSNSHEKKKQPAKEQPIQTKIGVKADKKKYQKRHQLIAKEIKEVQQSELPTCIFTKDPINAVPIATVSTSRRRKIPEVIQEDAANILAAPYQHTRTQEDYNDEIDEVKEIIEENSESQLMATTEASIHIDIELTNSGENNATLSDNEDNTDEKDATENA